MRRRLFPLASLLSLLLCVATVVLWVQTYRLSRDRWWYRADRPQLKASQTSLFVFGGEVMFRRESLRMGTDKELDKWLGVMREALYAEKIREDAEGGTWGRSVVLLLPRRMPALGFRWASGSFAMSPQSFTTRKEAAHSITVNLVEVVHAGNWHEVHFPIWSMALVFAVLPGCFVCRLILSLLRRLRSKAGLCPSCSYNLTGNTSGVCPECGTPVAGKAGA